MFDVGDDLPAWYAHARCQDADPAAFFPEQGDTSAAAMAICDGCPVVEPCLQLALDEGRDFGVWGGMTARERARLARQAA